MPSPARVPVQVTGMLVVPENVHTGSPPFLKCGLLAKAGPADAGPADAGSAKAGLAKAGPARAKKGRAAPDDALPGGSLTIGGPRGNRNA